MTHDMTDIRRRIKKTITSCLELPVTPAEIDDEAILFAPALVGGLDLDSLSAVEIIVGLSREFELSLDEVPRGAFRDVSSLGEFIREALEQRAR